MASAEGPSAIGVPSVMEGVGATGETPTLTVAMNSVSRHRMTVGCVGRGERLGRGLCDA